MFKCCISFSHSHKVLMKSTSAALITFHIDSFFFSFLLQKRFHCWPVNINRITKITLLFKHCNIHKKHRALSRASSSRDETGRGSCEVMRLFGFRHKHFSSPPSQWHCSSLAGDKLVVFTLCSSPSSAGGSAWARWGLKAPGWPWRGTSCPAAPPPPSGPRSTGPKAGRRTPGSAGSCSCRLRTSCCRPPEEKHQGHRPSENSHRTRTFHKKFSVFLVPGGFLYWCSSRNKSSKWPLELMRTLLLIESLLSQKCESVCLHSHTPATSTTFPTSLMCEWCVWSENLVKIRRNVPEK